MNSIAHITLEVADTTAANNFYKAAFDLGDVLRFRQSDAPTTGFRGFTLSLIVSQPGDVHALFDAGVAAGADVLKPVAKSMWGHGGVLRAPDGSIWKVATPKKKDTAPVSTEVDEIVLLLGVDDVVATKRFYVDRGFTVGRSFARTYAELDAPAGAVKLALYKHRALAKDAGVAPDGTGSHRLVIGTPGESFIDPDGFVWEGVGTA